MVCVRPLNTRHGIVEVADGQAATKRRSNKRKRTREREGKNHKTPRPVSLPACAFHLSPRMTGRADTTTKCLTGVKTSLVYSYKRKHTQITPCTKRLHSCPADRVCCCPARSGMPAPIPSLSRISLASTPLETPRAWSSIAGVRWVHVSKRRRVSSMAGRGGRGGRDSLPPRCCRCCCCCPTLLRHCPPPARRRRGCGLWGVCVV